MALQRLEGRNPVVECLERGRRRVHRIWLDQGAKPEPRVAKIVALASEKSIPLEMTDRRRLDRLADGRVHNGVIAEVDPVVLWTAKGILDADLAAGRDSLLLLADGLQYEHNLGAILRSSLGFGVTGVVVPTRRGAGLTPVVARVSMGAVEEVPIAKEGMFPALKALKKSGVRVVGADGRGEPLGQTALSGPLALVLGEEGAGLSSKVRERCDALVSIPLAGDLESLNVSVAAAVLLYEKRRQDGWFSPD